MGFSRGFEQGKLEAALLETPVNHNNNTLKEEIRHTERDTIIAALERNNWRRQKTANELKINRVTLYNKMKKYGIEEK